MKKYIFIFIGVIAVLGIITFVTLKSFNSNIKSAQKDPRFEKLPPIMSQIKTLEVVNARIINPGSPDAVILIDVRRNCLVTQLRNL